MIALKYGDKYLKVLDEFNITTSSREVTFNDLNVDFTGYTINDLPTKYQEVQLVEISETVKRETPLATNIYYTGYIESYTLPEMHNTWEDKILSLTLISPYALTTLRSISSIKTDTLENTLLGIIQPLIDDGFILKEMIVSSATVTTGYMLETVETCLNDLSNKYNFWWYIDEKKNIYFYDIEYLTSKNVEHRYNLSNMPAGSMSVSPSMDATDYCNVINFKNVRMYVASIIDDSNDLSHNPMLAETSITLNKGDSIDFKIPIDLTVANIKKSIDSNVVENEDYKHPFIFEITKSDGNKVEASIKLTNNNLVYSNIGESNSSTSEQTDLFTIKFDSFFKTLVTGITYNGEETITGNITKLITCSGLQWIKMKFINNIEVDKCKGVVSTSGRIEKIIDLDEAWRTEQELKELASSYLKLNLSQTDELTIELDRKPLFGIGDTVYFDLDEFFTNNNYIVTDVEWNYKQPEDQSWKISLRNKNYLANFIDVFRGEAFENSDDKDINMIVVNYVNEELFERHEVI